MSDGSDVIVEVFDAALEALHVQMRELRRFFDHAIDRDDDCRDD